MTLDEVIGQIDSSLTSLDEAATALALSDYERANILLRRGRISLECVRSNFNPCPEAPCSRP